MQPASTTARLREWARLEGASQEELRYFDFHRKRFEFLVAQIAEVVRRLAQDNSIRQPRILDVGVSMFNQIIRRAFPQAVVSTLGLEPAGYRGAGGHFQWNLNEAQHPERWPLIGACDLIVLAEVLEHLYTAPQLVLACLSAWLAPGGYLLIQTPNAASLEKRLRLLRGENPYEMIRTNPDHPGHFREYTVRELRAMLADAGLQVAGLAARNYFSPPGWHRRAYRRVCDFLPPAFREGITIRARKMG